MDVRVREYAIVVAGTPTLLPNPTQQVRLPILFFRFLRTTADAPPRIGGYGCLLLSSTEQTAPRHAI